jgi:hypothetical protein
LLSRVGVRRGDMSPLPLTMFKNMIDASLLCLRTFEPLPYAGEDGYLQLKSLKHDIRLHRFCVQQRLSHTVASSIGQSAPSNEACNANQFALSDSHVEMNIVLNVLFHSESPKKRWALLPMTLCLLKRRHIARQGYALYASRRRRVSRNLKTSTRLHLGECKVLLDFTPRPRQQDSARGSHSQCRTMKMTWT